MSSHLAEVEMQVGDILRKKIAAVRMNETVAENGGMAQSTRRWLFTSNGEIK